MKDLNGPLLKHRIYPGIEVNIHSCGILHWEVVVTVYYGSVMISHEAVSIQGHFFHQACTTGNGRTMLLENKT